MNQIFLYIWLSVTLFTIATSLLFRLARGKKLPTSQEFFVAAYTLGGSTTLLLLLFKVISKPKLQEELEWDGTIAIIASAVWITFMLLKEVVLVLYLGVPSSKR